MQCYIQLSWCIGISPTVPCFGGIIYKYTETAGTLKLLFFRIKEFTELVKKNTRGIKELPQNQRLFRYEIIAELQGLRFHFAFQSEPCSKLELPRFQNFWVSEAWPTVGSFKIGFICRFLKGWLEGNKCNGGSPQKWFLWCLDWWV